MTRGRYKVIEPFKRLRLSPNIEMIEKNKILIGQEPVVNRNRLKKNTGTTPQISTYNTFWNSCSKTFRQKYLFNNEHSTILFRKCFRKNQIEKSLSTFVFDPRSEGVVYHFFYILMKQV